MFLNHVINSLQEYGAPLISIVICALIIIIGRLILNHAVSDKRTLPFRRQFLTIIVIIIGMFLTVALLPTSPEIRSQILSVMGIILSAVIALSSTTLAGNAMAGIMLSIVRGFRAGDFVQIGDLVGRVADIGLLHCEIQKVTRDIAVVPNSVLIKNAINITRRRGTFVNASVSIGYDEHHSHIEALLIQAAGDCELAEAFVTVEELLDHAVQYRVYGLLEDSNLLLTQTSNLKKSILSVLHSHHIEIASPSLVNRREYNQNQHYIPKQKAVSREVSQTEQVEEIAFDKAEEAESIDKLYAMQKKLIQERQDIDLNAKKSDTDNEIIAERKKQIDLELKRIQTELEFREKQKLAQKLDEDSTE